MALEAKRVQVESFIAALSSDLKETSTEKKLSNDQRRTTLEKLKVHGRDAKGSDAIFTKDGIKTLGTIGLKDDDVESSREALRCIANAMLLAADTRRIFIDHEDFIKDTCAKYASDSEDDEFLLARVLFWCTYTADASTVATWASEYDLVKNISKALSRHAKFYSTGNPTPSMMMTMALSETLKLMFNVESKLPDQKELFSKDVEYLFGLLRNIRLQIPPFQPPVTHVMNALSEVNFNDSTKEMTFPNSNPQLNVERLVNILDKATSESYKEDKEGFDFDEQGASLLKILYILYPSAPKNVQKYFKQKLLPTEEDRDKPLGRGSSISARLLKITTSAMTPNTRDLTSALLYLLSDSDPSTFVQNVGYGFASGYLMSQGIPLPQEALGSAGAGATSAEGRPINPITGQVLEMEDVSDLPEMTEEEREREAERLFVLFERLNNTGVINVENPVRRAQQEGRFEDLD